MDDDPDVCWIIAHILNRAGFVCEAANTVQEAFALIHRQPFRMAFLDAKLGVHEGLDLAWGLRELDPSLPIILISGYFYREDAIIQGAKKSGLISAFISKPFEHQEILRVVELHGTR
ncbi:MAG: response regulator [Longimicrobiales bacterium]|nr:response regulator [Longimicrobiales bacterium]